MNKLRVLSCAALAAIAFSTLPACARDCAPRVADGWLRLPPVSMPMPMLAGFGRIENTCAQAVTIIGVRSDAFADVSLHESTIVDGISRMRPLPRLTIVPDGSATLQPGGLHLMLMQPVRELQAGEQVTVEFLLEGGGTLPARLEVRAAGAGQP